MSWLDQTLTIHSSLCCIIIHRHNDEYITAVFVPGSLLRSIKECQLGYLMGVPGSLLNFSHSELLTENFACRIDALLETGSSRPMVKSA